MGFVDFELAKKLKEKWFREKVNAYYGKHENIFEVHPSLDMNDCYYSCSAPTISQVLKWLREQKKMYLEIFLYNGTYSYFVKSITQICKDDLFHKCLNKDTANEEYTSYEEAAIA